MIRHIVAFRFTGSDAERVAHAAEAARRLDALVGVVPSLRSLSAGAEALYPGTNWDLGLVADFDDEAGLDAYQVHAAHKEVGAFIRSALADRVAVDFQV